MSLVNEASATFRALLSQAYSSLGVISSGKYLPPTEESVSAFLSTKQADEINTASDTLRTLTTLLYSQYSEMVEFDTLFNEAFSHLKGAIESITTPEDAAIQQLHDQRVYMQQMSLASLSAGPSVVQPPPAAAISAPSTRRSVGRSLVSDSDLRKAIDEFKREQRIKNRKAAGKGDDNDGASGQGNGDHNAEDDDGWDEQDVSPPSLLYNSHSIVGGKDSKTRLTAFANRVLTEWLEQHCLDPYPDAQEKDILCGVTGLSKRQIDNWFVNNRKRKWQPLFDFLKDRNLVETNEESSENFRKLLVGHNISQIAELSKRKSSSQAGAAGDLQHDVAGANDDDNDDVDDDVDDDDDDDDASDDGEGDRNHLSENNIRSMERGEDEEAGNDVEEVVLNDDEPNVSQPKDKRHAPSASSRGKRSSDNFGALQSTKKESFAGVESTQQDDNDDDSDDVDDSGTAEDVAQNTGSAAKSKKQAKTAMEHGPSTAKGKAPRRRPADMVENSHDDAAQSKAKRHRSSNLDNLDAVQPTKSKD
eukprot:ANDGO_08085.mRNA.1 BEL1-like homeodomain protein 11